MIYMLITSDGLSRVATYWFWYSDTTFTKDPVASYLEQCLWTNYPSGKVTW